MQWVYLIKVKEKIKEVAKSKGVVLEQSKINELASIVINENLPISNVVQDYIDKTHYKINEEMQPEIKKPEKKKAGRKKMEDKKRLNLNITEEEHRFLTYLKEKHKFSTITDAIRYCINQQRTFKKNFK